MKSDDSDWPVATSRGCLSPRARLLGVVLLTACGRDDRTEIVGDELGAGAAPTVAPNEDPIERGRYLVSHVAVCSDCHSPRLADASFDPER